VSVARRHLALGAAALLAASRAYGVPSKDLYFGEALYYAYQERWFEALERLDGEIAQHEGVDEPGLDTLFPYIDHAEFSVGDFELNYRMHHRAGRAIKAVLEGDIAEPVRNEAAFRLARIQFQKAQPQDALRALERIRGDVPEEIRDDVELLRANVYLALRQPSSAIEVLRQLHAGEDLRAFSAYNLGIALLQEGQQRAALQQLDRAGQVKDSDSATLAIRDKANFVLGMLLFEDSEFAAAQRSLDRVGLEGPFSNQALLRAGWADASVENFDRALVPWSILAQRAPTDAAVQEAMLALAYAYSKVDVHGRAALLYGRAVETFGEELEKVDASIRSIREGEFLKALVREEIRQDKDWVIRLRSLPETPETFYLMALMASHDFQTALQNYLDLEDLRKRLVSWQGSLDAFEDVIRLRRQYYEPLLPGIDQRFRKLDSRMRLRLEQREHVARRLEQLLTAPRPSQLATADEQELAARISSLEERLGEASGPPEEEPRLRRLAGVLRWRLETRYHQRLTDAHAHLRELDRDVKALQGRYESFVRTRQAATHSYEGYQVPIQTLRMRVAEAHERVEVLMARQGHTLETVAIQELEVRRSRLTNYLHQARFAFADSYDRAAKAQGR
jgi:predicted negative regulator of RcsB-dependent stress response